MLFRITQTFLVHNMNARNMSGGSGIARRIDAEIPFQLEVWEESYAHVYVCMYVCMHACMYVCIYVYRHIQTDIHT